MAALTFFTVTGTYFAAVADSVYDVDNDPELTPMSGTVTFTPLIDTGDSIPAPTLTPPANLWLVPIKATIKQGVVTSNGATGVKLTANTAVLGLSGNLFYRVDFYDGLVAGGKTYHPDSFTFQAPTTATTIDLVTVTPLPGSPATGNVLPVLSVAGKTGAIMLVATDINATGTPSSTTFLRGDNTWATPAGGGSTDIAATTHAATSKTTPVDADEVPIVDSAASNGLKKLTFANLKAWVKANITSSDVGLGNVTNTSDANKPVSTAQQAALLGLVQAAKNPDLLITGAITLDGNDLVTSAAVAWPDGSPGTLTITSRDGNNAVLGYNITYGSPVTKTFTQPAITRNANGAATNIPAVVVS